MATIDITWTSRKPRRLLVKCPRSENARVKRVGGGRFNKRDRGWTFSPDLGVYEDLTRALPGAYVDPDVHAWYERAKAHRQELEHIREGTPVTLTCKNQQYLYPFQRTGVGFLLKARRTILGDDMGLGKTVEAIITAEEMRANKVLIIAPNNLKHHWYDEIRKWAPDRRVLSLVGSTRKKRTEVLNQYVDGYFIIHYEAARRGKQMKKVDGKKRMVLRDHDYIDELLKQDWDVVIVDEAHNIKNRKTQQSQDVSRLAKKAPNAWFLTGTPIMNRVPEVWSLLHVINPDRYTSFWSFVKKYANAHPGRFGWVIDDHASNPDALREEIAPYFIRREKEEVFPDMPEKTRQKIWLEMGSKQARLHDQMWEELMAEISDQEILVAPIVLSKIMRCRQIAISPELVGSDAPSVKLEALVEFVQSTDEKIVVFSQFAEAISLAARELRAAGAGCTYFTGASSDEEQSEAISALNTDPETQVLLTTLKAGGEGLDFTAASVVILLDKHWTPATNKQAEDRVHRHGQTKPVTVIELIALNSEADRLIEDTNKHKKRLVDAVIERRDARAKSGR